MPPEYSLNIEIADSLFFKKDYELAGRRYNSAFRNKLGYSSDYHRLLAALAWAKFGNNDSAIIHLNFLVYAIGFSNCDDLPKMFESTKLRTSKHFNNLLNRCNCRKEIMKKGYKPAVAKVLASIYLIDQSSRSLQGNFSTRRCELSAAISQSYNLRIVDSLHRIYGWLSTKEVGYNAALAQFLVIQHSDLPNMQMRLSRVRMAVKECLLTPENLALLEDRILMLKGKKQKYGTQLRFDTSLNKFVPFPIKNEKSVNKRRHEIGMDALESY